MISFTTDVLASGPAGADFGRNSAATNDASTDSLFRQRLDQAQSQSSASSQRRDDNDERSDSQRSTDGPANQAASDNKDNSSTAESPPADQNSDRLTEDVSKPPVDAADEETSADDDSVESLLAPVAIVEAPPAPDEQITSEIVSAESDEADETAEVEEPEMSKLHASRATIAALEGETQVDPEATTETPDAPDDESSSTRAKSKVDGSVDDATAKAPPVEPTSQVQSPAASEDVASTPEASKTTGGEKPRSESKSSRRGGDSRSAEQPSAGEGQPVVAGMPNVGAAAIEAAADRTIDSVAPRAERSSEPAQADNRSPEISADAAQEFRSELEAATENQSANEASSTGAADESDAISTADRVRFVQRVARAFHSARGGDGEIRLRLSPPELGSLRVELKIEKGALTGRIEAETPAARSLLLDSLPALRDRLAEQNIKVDRFDVDLMQQDPQGQSPHSNPQHDLQRQFRRNALRSAEPVVETRSITAERGSSPHGAGTLNVVI